MEVNTRLRKIPNNSRNSKAPQKKSLFYFFFFNIDKLSSLLQALHSK
ncbi:unnamed protein product [Brugia timori]|uniref:Uncharacterized protein n=1 Tax=Brugia timori TaxID=42155 RepID=A0A3P7TAE2_9BILA|nr:unnamed protein product [Brugia timori]